MAKETTRTPQKDQAEGAPDVIDRELARQEDRRNEGEEQKKRDERER